MIGVDAFADTGDHGQRGDAGIAQMTRHLESLRHKRTIEPSNGHDIANRTERDQIQERQERRFVAAILEPPGITQRAVQRDS